MSEIRLKTMGPEVHSPGEGFGRKLSSGDYNYMHRENIYGCDLFGLGNILIFLAGKGDVLLQDLRDRNHSALTSLCEEDLNIVFNHRMADLKKVYPCLPEALSKILLHFSQWHEHLEKSTVRTLSGNLQRPLENSPLDCNGVGSCKARRAQPPTTQRREQ